MKRTLLVIAGIALLALPSVHAQGRGRSAGFAPRGGASAAQAYSGHSAYNRGGGFYRGSTFGGGRYRGGDHHYRGRYYYLGGVPYFYPYLDYGFGYPYYYGSGFGFGYASPYYYDYAGPGPGYYDVPAYEGRVVEESTPGNLSRSAQSLPSAVQRQLARRGYYKGSIDGQFGEGSRSALRRFQRDNDLKETGRIDEATLKALGFTDRR